jgi:putative transposase
MAPLVRRSWSWRGEPPALKQKAGHREKVSVAGALWLTPLRDRLGLTWQTIVNGYFNNEAVAGFLGDVLDELHGAVIVIWDGGTMHKGDPINLLRKHSQARLALELLPSYAAELMPLEQVWAWLKYDRLCNYAPENACALNQAIFRELNTVRDDQEQLRSFFHASDLPLPRALLL